MTEKKQDTKTDFGVILSDLDGGVFNNKVGTMLSKAALAAVLPDIPGRKATVTIKMEISQVGNSSQVVMKHTLSTKIPTRNGDTSDTDKTETPLYVGYGGRISLTPPMNDPMGQGQLTDGLFKNNKETK